MIIRHLIVPLTVAIFAIPAADVKAQGAFPAPLPGAAAPASASPFPPVNGAAAAPAAASPFPPVNGAPASAVVGAPSAFPSQGAPPVGGGFSQPGPQQAGPPGGEACMKEFLPLRQEVEKRGAALKAAGERRAPPDEACNLLKNFSQSELKMIKYVDINAQKCGIPPNVGQQMKAGHKSVETMQKKVCAAAEQQQRGPAGPSLSDVLGSSSAVPQATASKKSGGSTFDTLNGNVLAR